ncbi:ArsR/SmtB family transcription factor [Clostridium hydrogeniformans]|uniref:ArsR/SmtB family transcription factor n=1 Tax=Clostridium hydrogeniformans TaxID=349933 RepID=UPI0004854E4A|nr:metalloregulator ArsR/SmtB family transcription factor [Clostridium hydrogeniformans]
MDILEVLKMLSDTTRLRILNILYDGDLCVCEIEHVLELTQSNASRHLNNMSKAKVLESYKVNKYTYYKINEELYKDYPFVEEVIGKELLKNPMLREDKDNLIKYKDSGLNCDCLTKKC